MVETNKKCSVSICMNQKIWRRRYKDGFDLKRHIKGAVGRYANSFHSTSPCFSIVPVGRGIGCYAAYALQKLGFIKKIGAMRNYEQMKLVQVHIIQEKQTNTNTRSTPNEKDIAINQR